MARFAIRMDRQWRLLLLPLGATKQRSFVEVTGDEVRFHFGFLFDRTISRGDVELAFRRPWPLWMGIGWRTNFRGLIGLIGSDEGVVEIKLKEREQILGPFSFDRIAVSLEDPDVFVAALGHATPAEQPAPTPASEPRKARRVVAEAPRTETKRAPASRTAAPKRSTRTKSTPAVKKPLAKRGTTRKRRGDGT